MRPMSVFLILLSSGISALTGVLLDRGSPGGTANYRAVYYGTRCLIQHSDPYRPSEFVRVYSAESGEFPSDPGKKQLFLRAVPICVNLPTTLFLLVPLGLLPWNVSHVLWLMLIAVGLAFAALLIFDFSREYAPGVSLFLICMMLANSEVLFTVGNTAGIVISLCVVSVWCFVKERYVRFAILCLAVSLAIKPHDSGLIWLCLLLAGGALRKRALQTAALAAVIAAPAILWVGHVAPQWRQELTLNLATTSSHGDISDPGPDDVSRKGTADVIIDLQTVFSVLHDDPRFYNPATYMICGALLAILAVALLRAPHSPESIWYALASISALTMLATYHRPYDAKLLLLAVPACALLWAEGGALRHVALALTALAVTFTGDIPLAALSMLIRNLNLSEMGLTSRIGAIWLLRPAPLTLLATSVFYMWIYVRRGSGTAMAAEIGMSKEPAETSTPASFCVQQDEFPAVRS